MVLIKRVKLKQEIDKTQEVAISLKVGPSGLENLRPCETGKFSLRPYPNDYRN
jgi:hypothetical protein